MLALVKSRKGEGFTDLEERPVPTCDDGEVLIRVAYSGICGTDIHILHDQFAYYPPVILGHEFSGEVVKIDSGVTQFEVGDRVVIMGVGPIALLSAQMARVAGAGKILLCGCTADIAYRLEVAKELKCFDRFINVQTEDAAKMNGIKNRLCEIKAAQERLVELMMQDKVESDLQALLNERAKKLADEKRELLIKIELLEAEESEVIQVINLSKKWTKANFEERRAVCNLLIDKIYIDFDGTNEIVWTI